MPEATAETPQTEAAPRPAPEQAPEGGEKLSPMERLRALEQEPLEGRADRMTVPALLLGLVLLVAGVGAWIARAPVADYPAALDSVEQLIVEQQFDEAIAYLNDPIAVSFAREPISPPDLARFFALSADAVFLSQAAKGLDVRANHARIVDLYSRARTTDPASITPARQARLAESLVALGDYEQALVETRSIPLEDADRRGDLLRQIITAALASGRINDLGRNETLAGLLNELRDIPGVSQPYRLWAIRKQTELRLRAGFPEEAIEAILPELARMESKFSPEAGQLFVLLAEAYFELGHVDESERHLDIALNADVLPVSDPSRAKGMVLRGRAAQYRSEDAVARDYFRDVAENFAESRYAAMALVGLGEAESAMGNTEDSLRAYSAAVAALRRDPKGSAISIEDCALSLAQRHDEHFEREQFVQALQYAQLGVDLYADRVAPPPALERLARTHRKLAESLVESLPRRPDGEIDLRAADPVTLEEARSHFYAAGEQFIAHAEAVQLGDAERYAASLYAAADSYDRANDSTDAIAAFGEYVELRRDDPKAVEAQRRLAQAHMSRGEYDTAIDLFEQLIAEHPTSKPAADSYIPLARAYLYVSDQENWPRAESLLMKVLGGGTDDLSPEAQDYRVALVELGLMYRQIGRYSDAIERITEALDRYEDLRDDPEMVFALADANRLAALEIAESLKGSMPASERQELQQLKLERLVSAGSQYETVRTLIDSKPERRRTRLDEVMLRNAMLYRADVTFDRAKVMRPANPEKADEMTLSAITLYDTAAQRYADEPASLVAMTQIVTCYVAMGELNQARTAQARAKARFEDLPDDAWDQPDLPMQRRHWEQWLESSVELDAAALR